MNNYIIMDFLYSVNNIDFYMEAITIGGDIKKVRVNKDEFIKWCKAHENDDQCYEISYYAAFYE